MIHKNHRNKTENEIIKCKNHEQGLHFATVQLSMKFEKGIENKNCVKRKW